jgi:hypothetical protein
MRRALHGGGTLYVSFKYGEQDGYLGRRWYTNMTEERLAQLVEHCGGFEALETGTFGNEHPDQPSFRWVYSILRAC